MILGETVSNAVHREVREEVGVDHIVITEVLGVQQRPYPETGDERLTVFFQATTQDSRTTWDRTVRSDDEADGFVFSCRFVPLARAHELLTDGQGQFLSLVTMDVPAAG